MNSTQSLTTYSRRLTYSNTVSYPDADALVDINMWYRQMIMAIVAKVQDFFWTWGTTNAVIGQNEYVMEQFTFTDTFTRDVLSIDSVSVQYSTTGDMFKLKKWDFASLDFDPTVYADYAWEPFYYVRDNSVFIFPSPTVAVTGWVKIFGNYRPINLTLSTTESEIKTPVLYNNLLSFYQCFSYWMSQWNENKADRFEKKFNDGILKMVDSLSIRDREVMGYVTDVNPYN